MNKGYGAPYIRAFFKDKELSHQVEFFKYIFGEDEPDSCDIKIITDNRNAPDLPEFQEGAEWRIIWGYIGGVVSNVRKIFMHDLKWVFDRENISLNINAGPKALVLKQSSSRKVYNNASLATIAKDMAEKHDIKVQIEVPKDYSNYIPKPDEIVTDLSEIIKKNVKRQAQEKQELADKTNQYASTNLRIFAKDLKRPDIVKLSSILPLKNAIITGNKSDSQVIKEEANKTPGGGYQVIKRDDGIIIKKRNFNQKPYRAYEYGGTMGDLLHFNPETKTKSSHSNANNLNFSGWNSASKTFFSGKSNNSTDTGPVLTKYQRQELIADAGKRNANIGGNFMTLNLGAPNNSQASGAADNTNVRLNVVVPIDVKKRVDELEKQLQEEKNKNVHDPTANNPYDAYNSATNARNNAELQSNPGNMSIVGDPLFESGHIVTIEGVSKKYSGNYYVIKSTHVISKADGYTTEAEITRQGTNLNNDKRTNYKKTARTFNPKTGERKDKPKIKAIRKEQTKR